MSFADDNINILQATKIVNNDFTKMHSCVKQWFNKHWPQDLIYAVILCPSPTVPNLLLNEDECKKFKSCLFLLGRARIM